MLNAVWCSRAQQDRRIGPRHAPTLAGEGIIEAFFDDNYMVQVDVRHNTGADSDNVTERNFSVGVDRSEGDVHFRPRRHKNRGSAANQPPP